MPHVYFVYLANLYLVGSTMLLKIALGVESEYSCFKRQLGVFFGRGDCVFYFDRRCVLKKLNLSPSLVVKALSSQ